MRLQLLYAASNIQFVGEEYLGISRIYAYLSMQGHDCDLVKLLFDTDKQVQFNKIDLSCDLYGIAIYNDSARFTFELIEYIRRLNQNAIIFLGSQFASASYELIFRDCPQTDFIVLGHGEKTIDEVMRKMEDISDIRPFLDAHPHIVTQRSLYGKTPSYLSITELCLPSRKILKQERILYAGLITKHGCAGRCSFCSVNEKPSYRMPESILSEIIAVYQETGIQCFNFVDSSFPDFGSVGKANLKKFCSLVIRCPVKFSFRCYIRADSFHNEEEDRKLLLLMKEAGFYNIFIGIESANAADLALYNKRASVQDNNTAVHLLKQMGIHPRMGFIMLNPYSTEQSLSDNYEFLLTVESTELGHYISCLDIYYNSEIYHKLVSDGLLREDYSYIDNQAAYHLTDKKISPVFQFIRRKFWPSKIFSTASQYENFMYTLAYLLPILGDQLDNYVQLKKETDRRLFMLHKNYFKIIYKDHDLEKAERLYDEYVSQVIPLHNACAQYTNGLLRHYIVYQLKNKEPGHYDALQAVLKESGAESEQIV